MGARDTLRLEVCFHLYGNDLSEERGPIEAGLGWCCKEETGFIGAKAIAEARNSPPTERLAPFVIEGSRDRTPGNPVVGGGEVTSGTFSPCLETRDRDGVRFRCGLGARHRDRDRRPAGRFARPPLNEASLPKGILRWHEASYPADLLYHSQHDWARVEGDEATFGITWYAQDALGEVVYFDVPKVGATVSSGEAYAEVESVKAVSDVYAPLSGEIVAVNDGLADQPEAINEDPYGNGWLVKVKLSDPSEGDALTDAAAYEASLT